MTQRIGFVGLGRMGANMARRLKDVGYEIAVVFDRDPALTAAIAGELGARAAAVPAEVTAGSDAVFTVVSDDAAMREIYEAEGNLLTGEVKGKLFINCATVSPDVHVALMALSAELGAAMLEVPMASSIPQARSGELFLMCAGERQTYEAALPLLDALSATLVYTGGPGTAASLKLLVNMIMNINTAALAEGLGLADALGLDLTMVREVFAKTGANSRVLETDGADMQYRDHDTYFSAAHAAKDSGLALALGQSQGLPMVLARAVAEQYRAMVDCGLGELDKSGVSELTFPGRRPVSV